MSGRSTLAATGLRLPAGLVRGILGFGERGAGARVSNAASLERIDATSAATRPAFCRPVPAHPATLNV